MSTKIITTPDLTTLVTDADLRKHLRIAADGSEDEMMRAYFAAAHKTAEHYTGYPIGSQTREIAIDAFPDGAIDIGPAVTAISSVKYTDTAGVVQTVSGANYSLDDYGIACRVLPAYGFTWPAARSVENAVKVQFVAGDLPDAANAALLLMTTWMFEHRGDEMTADDIQPPAAKSLLNTVKDWAR